MLDGVHERLRVKKYYELVLDIVFCTIGSLIYGISVSYFTAPNEIAPGGATGIATVLYYMIHTPIGVMIFVLNIPLFVLGLRLIGGSFMVKSIVCTALTSIFVDSSDWLMRILSIAPYHGDKILAGLFGGLLSGVGLGLVFLRGATTGGTDIASRLLKLKFRHVPMGRMMLIIDACIILFSTLVFKNINSALYAIISIFTSSRVIDGILYGSDTGRMAVIISKCNDQIAEAITNDMNRGLTILRGKGYYTGEERDVIMCAVRSPEAVALRNLVKDYDPTAFIIMCEAGEVIGEGFKPITKDI